LTEQTQRTIFASQVLPSLFHGNPEEFIHYLSRDGNKFLRFYWEQAGAALQDKDPAAPLGLNYDIRSPEKNTTVVLITLPPPQSEPEAYFAALVYRPLRRMPFLGIADTTKVLVLEREQTREGTPGTLLREWSRKLSGEMLGRGTPPRLESFYDTVLEQL